MCPYWRERLIRGTCENIFPLNFISVGCICLNGLKYRRQMRATGIQIFIFLKLERNSTINHVMTLKSTVSSPLLDQISFLLSDAARNINNEKHIFIT